MEPKSLVL
jgi:hypothetical protein